MFIFAIDDERDMLEELHEAIHAAEPEAELMDFETAPEVLRAIAAGAKPDVVFSDIRLPGMDGLSLAVRIREKVPEAKLIFVTGYSDYAVEAYRRHVNGYVMKPVEPGRIREELDALRAPHPVREPEDKLRVQCFGHFEVFWHGEPLLFQRRQTKELFAFLIDREGRACTSEEIAASLWEDGEDVGVDKQRVRNLISDLRQTLRAIGMEEILIRQRRQLAIRRDLVDCDYYRMLEGDAEAVNSFIGLYMTEYSWAEITEGELRFRRGLD